MKTLLIVFASFAIVSGCSVSSTADELKAAISSHDRGTISRAFHDAIYDRFAKMDEVLPVVRRFLQQPDPFVRIRAAEALYTAGDRSGFPVLIALVGSPEPQMDGKWDLRIRAARILSKYREKDAAGEIARLYSRTSDPELLGCLATLGMRLPDAKKYPFVPSDLAIKHYAMIGADEFIPQMKAAFISPKVPEVYQAEVKQAAAWGMYRLTKDTRYLDFLIQEAQPAITGHAVSGGQPNESEHALRYLGSLRDPHAREVLETALDSPRSGVVECAVINLLFNPPRGSVKARQVILRQLKGVPLVMESWERTLQIAVKLDDPEMRAAGEAFDRRSGDKSWRYWAERKSWPIYNWIDDYVVALDAL